MTKGLRNQKLLKFVSIRPKINLAQAMKISNLVENFQAHYIYIFSLSAFCKKMFKEIH